MRKRPPFVEFFRDRHGKPRLYFRKDRRLPRIRLPGVVGSPEFNRAYEDALAGRLSNPTLARPAVAAQGTIEALVRSYMQNREYRDLRQTTKVGYASRLESIRTKHGHRLVAEMTRERIVKAFLDPYADRPGAALSMLKMLRILIKHAITLGWRSNDPSLGIKRPKQGEVRSWTDAELMQFEAHWQIGTRQRLAFALMLNTGQRRSDVYRMTWADVTGDTIRVVQQKTGAKLTIALHSDLRAILAETKRTHLAILTTDYGRPFTVDGFSGFMRDAIKAAGLPIECQPHGLRKAAGRRLAEAGCSSRELMAVLGHKTLSEAERYTRDADQARLASAAVARLEGRKVNI
jgi:integrase